MNTLDLKIHALIMSAVLFTSCSSNNEPETGKDDTGAFDSTTQAIILGSSTQKIIFSRSTVNNSNSVTAQIAGWEIDGSPILYTTAPTWGGSNEPTTITFKASSSTQPASWNNQKYYNANPDINTYMRAWYPPGEITDGKVTIENTDGTKDFLLAENAVVGSAKDISGKDFAFKHATAQVKFVIKASEGISNGTTIKSITLVDVAVPNGFDFTEEKGRVTFSEHVNLQVSGINDKPIETNLEERALDKVYAMIKPTTSNSLKINVETNNASFFNVAVTIDNNGIESNTETQGLLEGVAYEILLTFTSAGISASATIVDWDSTGPNTVVIPDDNGGSNVTADDFENGGEYGR